MLEAKVGQLVLLTRPSILQKLSRCSPPRAEPYLPWAFLPYMGSVQLREGWMMRKGNRGCITEEWKCCRRPLEVNSLHLVGAAADRGVRVFREEAREGEEWSQVRPSEADAIQQWGRPQFSPDSDRLTRSSYQKYSFSFTVRGNYEPGKFLNFSF